MNSKLSKYKLSSKLNTFNKNKSLKQIYKRLIAQDHPYLSLVKHSIKPPMKICDFTSLPAFYKCPKTHMRFYNLSVFKYLRSINSEHCEKYYEIKTYGLNLQNFNK